MPWVESGWQCPFCSWLGVDRLPHPCHERRQLQSEMKHPTIIMSSPPEAIGFQSGPLFDPPTKQSPRRHEPLSAAPGKLVGTREATVPMDASPATTPPAEIILVEQGSWLDTVFGASQ